MAFVSKNPFTRKTLKEVTCYSAAQVSQQIQALHLEFQRKRRLAETDAATEIPNEILRIAEGLGKYSNQLSETLTLETGKPIFLSEAEVQMCIGMCHSYSQSFKQMTGSRLIKTDAIRSGYRLDPLGVIYKTIPFNFPIILSLNMLVPALMTGNCVLLRPPNTAPQVGEIMQQMFDEFSIKSTQVSFTHTDQLEAILANPQIQGVSFTGSTSSGASIAATAGRHLKKCELELGGNDPFIIMDDADLDLAVSIAVSSRLLNSGQVCFSAKRYIVHRSLVDEFAKKLQEKFSKCVTGDPMDRKTTLGPLASDELTKRYWSLLRATVEAGDEPLFGFEEPVGNVVKPSIFRVKDYDKSVLMNQEAFGPAFPIVSFTHLDEAIELANRTNYGLGATIICRDIDRAQQQSRLIDAGMVFINGMVSPLWGLPIGGVKHSGFGRECGQHGVESFANIKTFFIK